jgi:hypothetical protein
MIARISTVPSTHATWLRSFSPSGFSAPRRRSPETRSSMGTASPAPLRLGHLPQLRRRLRALAQPRACSAVVPGSSPHQPASRQRHPAGRCGRLRFPGQRSRPLSGACGPGPSPATRIRARSRGSSPRRRVARGASRHPGRSDRIARRTADRPTVRAEETCMRNRPRLSLSLACVTVVGAAPPPAPSPPPPVHTDGG